jgi:hypothetical protein
MVTFPISLIPTFFVPLFIMMHLLTFKRIADLRRERGAGHAVSAHATLPGRRIPSPTFQGAMKASINR